MKPEDQLNIYKEMYGRNPTPVLATRIKILEKMTATPPKTFSMTIDRIANDLEELADEHRSEIKSKTKQHYEIIEKHFEKELAEAKTEKEKAEIKKKINSYKSRHELYVKRKIKQKAIKLQEESGIKAEIFDWAKKPENNTKILIAFSGGKDSIACVLNLLDLGFDKNNMELWHNDVDGGGEDLFDWKCTKSYCKAFAKAFNIPILFSYAGGGIEREIFRENETIQPVYFQTSEGSEYSVANPEPMKLGYWLKDENNPKKNKKGPDGKDIWIAYTPQELYEKNTRHKFPAVSASLETRWCSGLAKISVMGKAINNDERFKNANILIVSGERRAESTARSLYIEFEKYVGYTKGRKVISWRGIVDWSEQKVWDIIKKHKVQPHPCYELGWGRCSCQLCIFGTKNIWASVNELSPGKVKRIAEIESQIGHTLYNEKEEIPNGFTKDGKPKFLKAGKNLNVIDAKVKKGISFIIPEKKKRWEKEALGEFVSPIFIDNWELPAGAFNGEDCGAS